MQVEILTAADLRPLQQDIAELKDMFQQFLDQQPKPLPDFLTPKEAQAALGYKARSTLNERLKAAGVSKVETPRGWRYRKEDILKLISD